MSEKITALVRKGLQMSFFAAQYDLVHSHIKQVKLLESRKQTLPLYSKLQLEFSMLKLST